MDDLHATVLELARRHGLPGAAVGVVHDGRVETAFTGVTSTDDPHGIDAGTLFQIGSVSKTVTATAVMRLVHQGRLDLDHRVRVHVPELRLADPDVADTVTVRHLLNHTAGWDGTLSSGDQEPDAPLAWFVDTTLPGLEQVGPLGARAEYNNAAVALAGRVVEKVTGLDFEAAVRALLLDPLGLSDTFFTTDDVPRDRVAFGHLTDADGAHRVARPWRWPRAGNPEGGLVGTVADQLTWARFHLGDGRNRDGVRLLDAEQLVAMRTPTVGLVGNPMGEAVGLGWFLDTVAGEATVTHSGATNGQFTELRLVPGRDFGVVACANAGPAGSVFVRDVVRRLLDERLDLRAEPRRPRPWDPAQDGEVRGTYANNLASIEVTAEGGDVSIRFALDPEVAARSGGEAPTFAAATIRFYADDTGGFAVAEGDFDGMTGAFVRADSGDVDELAFGGRWYRRDSRRP